MKVAFKFFVFALWCCMKIKKTVSLLKTCVLSEAFCTNIQILAKNKQLEFYVAHEKYDIYNTNEISF